MSEDWFKTTEKKLLPLSFSCYSWATTWTSWTFGNKVCERYVQKMIEPGFSGLCTHLVNMAEAQTPYILSVDWWSLQSVLGHSFRGPIYFQHVFKLRQAQTWSQVEVFNITLIALTYTIANQQSNKNIQEKSITVNNSLESNKMKLLQTKYQTDRNNRACSNTHYLLLMFTFLVYVVFIMYDLAWLLFIYCCSMFLSKSARKIGLSYKSRSHGNLLKSGPNS